MASRSLKARYEAFVLKNEGLVRKLQEVANVMVFLVPGNSLDGELAQEGLGCDQFIRHVPRYPV